ncbi:molybdopterin-guanine dinucleotide biosynthesis protein B [Gemmatimonadota bacterium]
MTGASPFVVCVIGKKNSGKTCLTVGLSAELRRRGRRVMTVKHGHGFQIDMPGKDSWRHRHEGGALRTVLAGPRDFAVVGRWPEEEMDLEKLVRTFLWDAEIVLAEGFKASPEPKIEVFRSESHLEPFHDASNAEGPPYLAMVTDRSDMEALCPVFDLDDPDHVRRVADLLEERWSEERSLPGRDS